MTHSSKKNFLTILIILVFVLGYGLYMYLRVNNDKFVRLFTGLIFLDCIWKKLIDTTDLISKEFEEDMKW